MIYMNNFESIHGKNKHHTRYHAIPSAIKLVSHGSSVLVSEPDVTVDSFPDPRSWEIRRKQKNSSLPGKTDRCHLAKLSWTISRAIWTYRRSKLNCWVLASVRNFYLHLRLPTFGIESTRTSSCNTSSLIRNIRCNTACRRPDRSHGYEVCCCIFTGSSGKCLMVVLINNGNKFNSILESLSAETRHTTVWIACYLHSTKWTMVGRFLGISM